MQRAMFIACICVTVLFLNAPGRAQVVPGVEVLVSDYARQLQGKRVGILTNPTGVDRQLHSTIDLVRGLPGVTVVRLFSPEHGIRGTFVAGQSVDEERDAVSGLPVVSLHGDSRRPTTDSLAGLDIVLYDIQDVGHRTYTFISTLNYMMEACEQAGVEVWVLDRPDPLGGDKVGGPMLDKDLCSFIGIYPMPQVYGMTPGEFARFIQRERFPRLKLTVVPMKGWRRGMVYEELGWLWVAPSEHIPRWESAFFYAMTGTLGELGAASEGVGTPLPFEQIGAPWIDGPRLAGELEKTNLRGLRFRSTAFKPRYGGFAGQVCQGVQIYLTDPGACQPAEASQTILATLARLYPERSLFAPSQAETYQMFLKALGNRAVAQALATGQDPRAAEEGERHALGEFLAKRGAALIYN